MTTEDYEDYVTPNNYLELIEHVKKDYPAEQEYSTAEY